MKDPAEHLAEITAKLQEYDDAEAQEVLYKEQAKTSTKKKDALGAELRDLIKNTGEGKLDFEGDPAEGDS